MSPEWTAAPAVDLLDFQRHVLGRPMAEMQIPLAQPPAE
jgi:hypothetical protein